MRTKDAPASSSRVPPRPGCPIRATRWAAALLVLLALPAALSAQQRGPLQDHRGTPFWTPEVSPVEPLTRIGPAHMAFDSAASWIALADLADEFPFRIHRDSARDLEIYGAVAGGGASRFDLERTNNEFIEIHYRLAFQLRARYRATAARLELYHVSSHLGDEYIGRTGARPRSTAREGLELLIQRAPLAGLIVYGGPGLVLRDKQSFRRLSVRIGADWTGPPAGSFRPYVGGEMYLWSELGWNPMTALEAGLRFGSRYSLGLTLGLGRSRAEQFFRQNETLVGLTLTAAR